MTEIVSNRFLYEESRKLVKVLEDSVVTYGMKYHSVIKWIDCSSERDIVKQIQDFRREKKNIPIPFFYMCLHAYLYADKHGYIKKHKDDVFDNKNWFDGFINDYKGDNFNISNIEMKKPEYREFMIAVENTDTINAKD
jgi:hypothetical protein